ncbi:MAG: hypothetical protein DRJ51_06290 [Thermoprotei archaeon]|nr:MAG: hypothetical protein DRJ51_06290 [Thermoprotei archaeon]
MAKTPEVRVFYLVIDQLAGHWEESVRIEGTDLPPVNVKGYHERGLIPNFSYLIENGLWVKRPWNRGRCDTPHGMKYLATGSYSEKGCYAPAKPWFLEAEEETAFFEFVKKYYRERINVGVFSCSPWLIKGYFYTPDSMHGLVSGYSDEVMLKELVFPWMENVVPKWDLIHVYLPGMDSVTNCPSYGSESSDIRSSKHSYMLFLDRLVGDVTRFLKDKGLWEETYFIIASDHGYHLGCSVARERGIKTNNWCCDHPPPWDCEVWDFKEDRSTGIYSGGPRRITIIVSGGALGEEYRGKVIEEAEIIDVIPTIAEILEVPYKCQGRSLFKYKAH